MRIVAAAGLAALLGGAGAPEKSALPGWLEGRWVSEQANGGWTEESWSSGRGDVLVGAGKNGRGETVRGFEFMRIARDPLGLAFHGSPEGKTAVVFREVRANAPDGCATAIAFRNPDHDYPQRISYVREGNTLTATISMDDGTNALRWVYTRAE